MLSIVIINHKSSGLLHSCVASLKETIKRTPYEIIAVDSESDGKSAKEALNGWNDIKLIIFQENTGYAKAVNAGLKKSVGDYILILNSDIKAGSGAVDDMINFMENNATQENIGMVGPRLRGFDDKIQQTTFRFYSPFTVLLRRTFLGRLPWCKKRLDWFLMKDKNMDQADSPQPVDWLMGAALLVSKKSLEKVGDMDERFFMYFEDVDWARRFWANGFKVFYFPNAIMYHMHGRASKKSGAMAMIHIKSAFLYFMKYRFKTIYYV